MPSQADGFCLLYSYLFGLSCLVPPFELALNKLLFNIEIECVTKIQFYASLLESGSVEEFLRLLRNYIFNKNYSSLVGDMMPQILCNIYDFAIIIVNRNFEILNILKSENFSDLNESNTIFLIKRGEHYDGLRFSRKEPPQNSNLNESFETNPSIQGRELDLKTQTSNRFNILLDAERSDGDESAGVYQKPTSGADMSASDVAGVMQGVGSTSGADMSAPDVGELMHGEAPSHTSAVLDNSCVPDSNE